MSRAEVFTRWRTWELAEPGLRARLDAGAAARVGQAFAFAARWHGDQRRPTGAPYQEHLLEALEILVRGAAVAEPTVLAAAVLHDVVEDTPCTPARISDAFGPRVAELVGWVTIAPPGPGQDKAAVKEACLAGLRRAPRDAILVKLADRASNVQTLRNLRPDRQRAYYAETVRHIVPLAASHPWFASWYAAWQADHVDLAS